MARTNGAGARGEDTPPQARAGQACRARLRPHQGLSLQSRPPLFMQPPASESFSGFLGFFSTTGAKFLTPLSPKGDANNQCRHHHHNDTVGGPGPSPHPAAQPASQKLGSEI